MSDQIDATVDALVELSLAGDATFQSIDYDTLSADVKAIEAALHAWNIDIGAADEKDCRKITFDGGKSLFVVELTGDPAEHFDARLVIREGKVIGKSISVSG